MKQASPLISVIIPVYNKQNYVAEAIQSILNQTYKNFELIILNDGSTDKSEEIILSFSDPRIKYEKHSNMGLSKTLNKAISIANGKYIARMDADDVSLPFRLEKQIGYLKKRPKTVLLGGGMIRVDKDGQHLSYDIPYTSTRVIKKNLLTKGNMFKHPTVMFNKQVVLELGGYNEEINSHFEDYYLWTQIAKKNYKINNLKIPLVKYRITPGSIMESQHEKEFIDMTIRVASTGNFTKEDKKILDKRKENKVEETYEMYKNRIYLEKKKIK